MPVESVTFMQPRSYTDTNRNPSPSIWADCPFEAIRTGFTSGSWLWDDFVSFNKTAATTEGNWSANQGYAQFASATGTLTAGTGQGGEVVLGATEDNEGVSFRTLAVPFKISRATKKFWFECRIKSSTITDTKHGIFVGLLENAALTAILPIAADGTLADNNLVGFHRLEGDGDKFDTVYKANGVTAVTVGTDAVTLEADTYVKLGIKYDPGVDPFVHDPTLAGNNKFLFKFFANGVKLTDHKQIPSADGTDFPNDVGLGLVLAILNATGTAEGTTTMDWWRAAQLL